jgi:hypothetical protein
LPYWESAAPRTDWKRSRQIKVTGDMMVLMKMQTAPPPTPEQEAFQAKIKALTA